MYIYIYLDPIFVVRTDARPWVLLYPSGNFFYIHIYIYIYIYI